MNLKKLRALQQEASEFAGVWFADGYRIIDEQQETIVKAGTPGIANYICMIHNTWLVLTNHILLLRRALVDKKAMTAVIRKESNDKV